jgi:hypothetical protein
MVWTDPYNVDHRPSHPLADFHPQIYYAHKHQFLGSTFAVLVAS